MMKKKTQNTKVISVQSVENKKFGERRVPTFQRSNVLKNILLSFMQEEGNARTNQQ